MASLSKGMQLVSPPFWILPFNNRRIGVALHTLRALVLFDPAGQKHLSGDRIRLYVAKENLLYLLYAKHAVDHLTLPKSERQARLGLRAYAAFLNPQIPRPNQFDPKPVTRWYDSTDSYSLYDIDRGGCVACNGSGVELTVHGVGTGLPCSYCGGSGVKS